MTAQHIHRCMHAKSRLAFGLSHCPAPLLLRSSLSSRVSSRQKGARPAKRRCPTVIRADLVSPSEDEKIATGAHAFLEGEDTPVIAYHRPVGWRMALGRPIATLIALAFGAATLPYFSGALMPLVPEKGVAHVDTIITGTFMPLVGILFAMLSSIGVSSLRQRQQDLRDVLNQELASIRMLLVMTKDESIVNLLLTYTLHVESETFSARKNGISFDHEVPETQAAIRREEAFARSEEILWKCFGHANRLDLRPEVVRAITKLVTLRTRRRAVLDSGLPKIHFIIVTLLGGSMLFAFGLLVANEALGLDFLATRVLFGILLALLSLTYALIADLRDPFGGEYGVTPWRLYRTVELLQARLKFGPEREFEGIVLDKYQNSVDSNAQ